MRRVNYIKETEEEPENEEQLVLRVDGNGCKPFYKEGMMCGNYFKAIIDTSSPVAFFTKRDLQKIGVERKVVIIHMIEGKRHVDYKKALESTRLSIWTTLDSRRDSFKRPSLSSI